MKNLSFVIWIQLLILTILTSSCNKYRSDPSKITMRPRVFVENSVPVPVIDEYDFTGVRIGTIENILTEDPSDRTYALWFTLDRRSTLTLKKSQYEEEAKLYN